MLPVVRELEAEYAGRLAVQLLDYYAAENQPRRNQYGVRGHPSFVVLGRDGTPSRVMQGVVPKQALVELIEAGLT